MSKKYRMSSAQKRMFAITEMHGNDIVYNVPMLWEIEGQINVERLQRSFSQLCARHEPLRTYFVHQKDKFLQVVKEEGDIYLDYEEASEDQIQQLFKEHVRPFNLGEAPLMRAKIVRISSNEHVLMLDIHHIIFDDGSKHVLLSDLCHFYNNEEIPPLRIHYKDYSAWLNSRDMSEQERYWTKEFSGEVSTLDLKTDYPRPQQQQYGGRSIDLLLPLELKARVKQLSHHSGATEYMILLACFMVLMNRYTRQDEIVVGSPIAGRVHAETDEMLGMFVNTLAIRGEFRTGMTFQTLLSQIQERCLKAYENQEYPFDELVEKIGVERDPSRNPLFDVMFVLQKNEQGSFKLGDALLTSMDVGLTVAKFDLTVSVEEVEEGYNVNWEYCDALFAADTLQHMALQFKQLVGEIMAQPDLVLSELGLITSAERKRVLAEFNNTPRECNLEKTAIMLFEEQVAHAPEHIAVEFQGRVLTYRELNVRANAVGAALLEKGVGPDQIVALIATRSLDMIIGIYGILKAGAAYLPIDPEQPLERIRYIIEDSGTSHIVFEENTKKTAAALEEQQGIQILNVAEVQEEIEENPQPLARPEHLAYVIYTSGTTGQPKGVLVENRNLVNLVSWQRATGELHEDSVMLQRSTYIFDAAVWEIFSILLAGGKLVLATESENRDPKELLELIAKTQVTHALIVPSSFRMILDYAELHQLAEQLMSLQKIYLGAEPLTPDLISKYTQLTGSGTDRLVNLYGPTEATVCATYMQLEEDYGGNVPIGRPLWNTQIYILQDDWLCGYGIPGELCIGGAGVARGYLNRTDLTNEKFVSNPYVPGGRIYRTGDLARWKTDGTIEYLGRIGDQVKIRGYRVEPGEIETHLRNIESVQDAVVVVKTDNTRSDYLCAYVVGEGELDGERIRENLRSILPSYMVPSYVVQLEALPLTRNGKLDKKALPEPDRTSTQTYTAPRNALEEVIATVFREVLGLEQVGIDDDFYTLGGDSIKAIRILSKMREQGYDLGVRTIMQGRTIRGMSSAVTASVASTAEQGEVTGQVNPTPIQCQFWSESLGEPHHFNQSFLLESVDAIHEMALRQALDAITAHHDMLRAVYREGVQTIRPIASGAAYEITLMDYRSITDQEEARTAMHQQADQMQRSLDLANGPLVSVGLFHTNERDYVLLIVHHLLIDGVSWRILLEDLQQAYTAIVAGQAVTLPPKTGSYAGWSKALERYGKSAELQQELGYWQTVEAQMEESGKHWSGRGSGEGIGHLEVSLNVKQTEALLYQANRAYHTEINDLLVTALAQAMWAVTGQGTAALQMEGHGRERIGEEYVMDRTVGWFTSIYPVAITGIGQDLGEDIQQTKEILRRVPNRGIGYGILKWLGESEPSGIEPEITLNYLGEFGQETNQGTWRLSEEERGEEVSEANRFGTPISVNGAVMDKRLQMRISYEREACDDRQMHALAEAFMHKLQNIVSHCIEVSTSQQTSSHAMGKGKYGAELLDPHKFHHNTDYPVMNRYAPSVLQQLFIRTADTVVMEKIELQGSRTQKEIIEACHRIIRMQSALRSSYRMDSLVGTISEHEWNHAWHMPYIDLQYASPDERNAVTQQISKLRFMEFNERSSQFLVKLVIVRDAERQHTIHIIAHHSVWDKTSTVIFKEMLDEGSTMNTRETLLSYSQYIADKHKHNDLFKGSGLALPGNMEKWIPVLHEYMDHNVSNEISQSVASVIPLGPHLMKVYKEKPWDLLMHAVQIIAKENGLIPPSSKRIPVFILQEDRAYTPGSYSHVMGEFLDMLPIVVQEAGETGFQSIQEQVEHIQKAKREQSIHYLELVHEIEEQLMDWLPSLLSVNFQAAFDLSYEDFKNMMTLNHYRTTNEIFVNRFADSLVIYYPIYSKCLNNLDAVLQKEFEWLEQFLSSVTTLR